jgi:hypothetical protein
MSSIPIEAFKPATSSASHKEWSPFAIFDELENYTPSDYVYKPPDEEEGERAAAIQVTESDEADIFPVFRDLYGDSVSTVLRSARPPASTSTSTPVAGSTLPNQADATVSQETAPSAPKKRGRKRKAEADETPPPEKVTAKPAVSLSGSQMKEMFDSYVLRCYVPDVQTICLRVCVMISPANFAWPAHSKAAETLRCDLFVSDHSKALYER